MTDVGAQHAEHISDDPERWLPEAALRRLAELRTTRGVFTSDLSTDEFLLVREAGFRPLELVMGSSVYHVGLQIGRWSKNQELEVLTQAMYHARELAMARMSAEAAAVGADGIVGVRLTIEFKEWGSDLAEFLAVGTAVKAEREGNWRGPHGPFTSDLSGQSFWKLLEAGYRPLGLAMGTCVYHIAHRSLGNVLTNAGRNVELQQQTEALYEARELAMSRMTAEAEHLGAEGIVEVNLHQGSHSWGAHTTEFFAIGTGITPIRADHVIARPGLVVTLND